jgi:signal transduction histidine kinase
VWQPFCFFAQILYLGVPDQAAFPNSINMKRSVFGWFRNISIAKRLYFTVGIMALLIALELGVLIFSIHTLSSVRAYVAGEGLWSKAQKDAMYVLIKYGRTHDEADYRKFHDFMKVPMGDRQALGELIKEKPDGQKAIEGFISGRNDPDDADGMVSLFRRFHDNYYIHKATLAWIDADRVLTGFMGIAEELHMEITSSHPSQPRIDSILLQVDPLNARLTPYEDEFSYTLGQGSRWLENVILRLLFIVALTVECTGLLLAITVSRGIQKGLKEVLLSSKAVAKGDYSRKARAFSRDEIGILARNFNEMADELEKLRKENAEVNISLEKKVRQRTNEIENKNKELEQFAYVASHDLQEPLRTISGFAEIIRKQYQGRLDGNAEKFLDFMSQASDRLKKLIKDLLDYSRIGREKEAMKVDCNALLQEVLADLDQTIKENGATVNAMELPQIFAFPTELKLLFQNLISNSIKFRRKDLAPDIIIRSEKENGHWTFSVTDNGIGIEPQYLDRIFVIFQRLHNRVEYEGSGIGLAHCKKIAELHGGKIWARSTPGEGSQFFFTIAGELSPP